MESTVVPSEHTDKGGCGNHMTVKIDNYAKKVERRGDYDWFEWKVFVNETDSVLSKIKEVIYLLHPTFKSPERVVKNKDERFALRGSGWGSFNMTVTIVFEEKR